MRSSLFVLPLLGMAVCTACQTLAPPSAISSVPVKSSLDPKTLTFRNPGNGDLFTLHLGDEPPYDSGGITEVPSNIKNASRNATSSYYEPTDKDGGGYATAESEYKRGMGTEYLARWTTIQYQPDSGRLLITEDIQDGVGAKRYILYTQQKLGGYKVIYLDPGITKIPGGNPIDRFPADVDLLPGDRARINGITMRVSEIKQSVHPFSL